MGAAHAGRGVPLSNVLVSHCCVPSADGLSLRLQSLTKKR
jgi:hypothetical protein